MRAFVITLNIGVGVLWLLILASDITGGVEWQFAVRSGLLAIVHFCMAFMAYVIGELA